jgi:hypothetical protein
MSMLCVMSVRNYLLCQGTSFLALEGTGVNCPNMDQLQPHKLQNYLPKRRLLRRRRRSIEFVGTGPEPVELLLSQPDLGKAS